MQSAGPAEGASYILEMEMIKKKITKASGVFYRVIFFAGYALLASPSFAKPNDTFNFQLGASFQSLNSEVQVGSQTRSNTATINLEDDLDLEEDVNIVGFSFQWRFADNHRIGLNYLPLKRDADTRIDEQLQFEDEDILAGAQVDSKFTSTIYDINYLYSVYKTSSLEVGLSAGLHWISTEIELQASGFIQDESGNIEFDDNYQNDARANAPLPLFGVAVNYQVTPNWELIATARYLDVEVGDYSGRIVSAKVAADYYFTDHLGAGMSLGFFDLSAEADVSDFRGSFGWEYTGLQAYLTLRY